MTSPLESRDVDLVGAVKELMAEVRKLNEQMKHFPRREEVQVDGRKRAWRFLAFAVTIILAAQLITMTLISYCFLDANSTHKMACSAMPGYVEAMEQNDIRLGRYGSLLDTIEKNQQRIMDNQKDIEAMQAEIAELRRERR